MLVLSRKRNEEVCIGNDIVVRVLAVKGSRVRLSIDAPKAIAIRRGELSRRASEQPLLVPLPADGQLHEPDVVASTDAVRPYRPR